MTTIVAFADPRLGVGMAADKQMGAQRDVVTKIFRLQAGPYEGCLIGVAGDSFGEFLRYKMWLETDQSEPPPPVTETMHVLLVDGDGDIWSMYTPGTPFTRLEQTVGFAAIGSGGDSALGALYMDASIEEAMGIAHATDRGTGAEIDILYL